MKPADAVYTATFTFAKRQFDADFHRLDDAIADAARSLPGYLGEEIWENPTSGLVSTVYYWRSLQALQALIDHPLHGEAKRCQTNWLQGYHVVIAQVLRSYGDSGISHPLTTSSES